MKTVPVEKAVGMILCHDITQIIPGEFKGRKFAKGHVITEEDIPVLKSLGKDNIFVWDDREGLVHENDAAVFLKDISMGESLTFGEIKEGKITFRAACDGLLKVDTDRLLKLNMLGEICFATLRTNTPVREGQAVAGERVIPLAIDQAKLDQAKEALGGEKIIRVVPMRHLTVGFVTTGNEVYYGRIQDKFGPILRRKIEAYGCTAAGQVIVPDDKEQEKAAIRSWLEKGVDMVLCTGGMSVDPDDLTPAAIRETGCEVITYGTPVLPGAMFMLAYAPDGRPVMGLPGCVMHAKTTVFDLVLPRILAGERITFEEMMEYGHGGYCWGCEECHFPNCQFGKY